MRSRRPAGDGTDVSGVVEDDQLKGSIAGDGSLAEPADPDQPLDGIIADGQRPSPDFDIDGVARSDGRFANDVAAFDNPPAGFDALAFEIEIAPILDRRPARLARFEPYDPIGIKAGSFTIFPEAEFALSATNNQLRTDRGRKSDMAFEFRPTVRVVSNWRTHALEMRATGVTTFHRELPSEDDRGYGLEARGRIDIDRRTNLELLGSQDLAQESRGGLTSPTALGGRADVTTSKAAATFNHRFNRLSVQLRGGLTDTDYSGSSDVAGIALGSDNRDYVERQLAMRAAWAFKPTFSVFSEIEHLRRTYAADATDGVDRDASGERYRLGVSFGNTGQKIRGEVSLGWGTERLDARGTPALDGMIIDANLAWRPTALTSFLWTAKSDLAPSTTSGTTAVTSRSTALEARHAFRRNVIGTAGWKVTSQDYEGAAPVSEREMLFQLGAEYFLNREVTIFSRYHHTHFNSSQPGSDYDADEVRVGVRVKR